MAEAVTLSVWRVGAVASQGSGRVNNSMTAAAASIGIVEHGEASWPLWLFELVDDLRRDRNPELVAEPPVPALTTRCRVLLACTVEAICSELALKVPDWCWDTAPLPDPWFVAGVENLKVTALVESPPWFRRRNVFVLGNFLNRA